MCILLIYNFNNPQYVLLANTLYKTDSTNLEIYSHNIHASSLRKLKYFSDIKTLSLSFLGDEEDLDSIPELDNLEFLRLSCLEINDLSFVNNFKNIDELYMFETTADFSGLSSESLVTMNLISCKLANMESIEQCSSLKNMYIYRSEFSGIVKHDNIYELQDSSVFENFNHIEKITIKGVKLADIDGFLKMKSLNIICVDSDNITEEQIKTFKKMSINVELE